MADVFKDGILYMDSLNDADIFSDIIRDQEKKEKDIKQKKEQLSREEAISQKAIEIKQKTEECFKEIREKMMKNPDTILFDENGVIYASNGYGLKMVQIDEDNMEVRVIIKE